MSGLVSRNILFGKLNLLVSVSFYPFHDLLLKNFLMPTVLAC
jgi:hypothetical protein